MVLVSFEDFFIFEVMTRKVYRIKVRTSLTVRYRNLIFMPSTLFKFQPKNVEKFGTAGLINFFLEFQERNFSELFVKIFKS